ncbi:FecR family protein [Chitinophaga silvatica]|uniref:FecR family protein n=1 Tax=Chitinophaga silvatica TaxID=2282649 RepID=A0A3E1Y6V9_9BACT|nr:FecR family protein [Chitinophaga silvatica]RFS20670.1 FecR family protein [Chitinophaga silvatica]
MDNRNKVLFALLLKKYREGTANETEKKFLETYYDLFDVNEDLITEENEASFTSLKSTIRENIAFEMERHQKPAKLRWLWKASAAAAILAFAAIATWYWAGHVVPGPQHLAGRTMETVNSTDKPTLQLANGAIIELNDSSNGQIAEQQGIIIRKEKDGSLVYQSSPEQKQSSTSEVSENILTTPKGMKYKVVLPDGSQVWLNAASSLRYPASFAADNRTVKLTGEAYFDVNTDAKRPFIVESGKQKVQVLGTSFNINAYSDEPIIKTTLLLGAVKVTAGNSSCTLAPGQQSQTARDEAGALNKREVDTGKEIAWMNNLFSFKNDDLQFIMRQISRWYNVEIKYNGNIPAEKFVGEISRSSNLNEVLRILEINDLRFEINGNAITVSGKK